MKKCSYCKIEKDHNNFYSNKARKYKLSIYCIECLNAIDEEKKNDKISINKSKSAINEEWKVIPEFENYEASTDGRIRNNKTKRILSPFTYTDGYYGIALIKQNNKRQTVKIHRIIAKTFLQNNENKATVNHINKIRSDNKVSNLEWATSKEQAEHKHSILPPTMKGYKKGTGILENIDSNEIWKIVPNYEEYNVSNYGRLKYKAFSKTRITIGHKTLQGYLEFRLTKNKVSNVISAHILVAKVFISNPDNKEYVNHKDGNKKNNIVNNLEWATPKENSQHAINNNLNNVKVDIYQLDKFNNIIKKWSSLTEASETLNIVKSNISMVINKQRKTAGSFYWCFIEEYNKNQDNEKFQNNKTKIVQKDIETGSIVKSWNSITDASTFLSIEKNMSKNAIKVNISKCLNGIRTKCCEYAWEYA